ncbi:helix-turn-helix domain-containing protein [Roseibium sp.]|uniref:AraC family transcriptional regulator n=1 Tax=Roseibium sp. TaxID=1936156 RepID=UPI003A979F34
MTAAQRWSRADVLGYLRKILPDPRLNWPKMAADIGFDLEQLDQPDGRIEMRALNAVFEKIAVLVENDAMLFDLFYDTPAAELSLYDYLFICAPTIGDGCQAWQRFIGLRCNGVQLSFTELDNGDGWLDWSQAPEDGPETQVMFSRMGWALKRIELALGETPAPVAVELASPAPRHTSKLQERYEGKLAFDGTRNGILFPSAILKSRPVRSEANLYAIIQNRAHDEMRFQSNQASTAAKVADAIAETMKTGNSTLAKVASQIGMSERSVQRALEEEGTTFRALTEEIRRSAAERYLKETDLPMKEIAFLLGFSEISTFSRAVKGWFGVPPKAYRKTGDLHEPA